MAEIDRRKASLIAELEISRSEMRSALAQCEESLDVVAQVRRNVRENKIAWLAGAVVLGYVASKVLAELWAGRLREAQLTQLTQATSVRPRRRRDPTPLGARRGFGTPPLLCLF